MHDAATGHCSGIGWRHHCLDSMPRMLCQYLSHERQIIVQKSLRRLARESVTSIVTEGHCSLCFRYSERIAVSDAAHSQAVDQGDRFC